jgi:flagellar hook-length control protein FliK
MTNLPINISTNIPAKTAVTPSASDDANHQPEQGFNNVLARQVSDSAKPDQAGHPSTDTNKQTAEQDQTAAATAPADATGSPTADMLATLLVQQNQTAAPQQDVQTQLKEGAQSTQNIQLPQGAQKPRLSPITASPLGKGDSIKPELTLETTLAKPESNIKINNRLVDAAKSAELKEFSSATHNPTLRGNFAGELAAATQQSGLASSLAATAPANPASIATAITQQPAWGEEFSQKITWMATQHNQSAELHLNPPQLGPLDVSLKMNGDQATATFTSPHAAVREAIEQALPKLREMLADSGIMLGNAMVSDQPAKNHADHAPGKSQGGSNSASSKEVSDVSAAAATRVSRISRHNGMVDTFA